MNLPPVGTKMLISDGGTYEILEYVDDDMMIVQFEKKGRTSKWNIYCIELDTLLTPLIEALI
jgi:hypothetical protein